MGLSESWRWKDSSRTNGVLAVWLAYHGFRVLWQTVNDGRESRTHGKEFENNISPSLPFSALPPNCSLARPFTYSYSKKLQLRFSQNLPLHREERGYTTQQKRREDVQLYPLVPRQPPLCQVPRVPL